MRPVLRMLLAVALTGLVAAPVADAAGGSATTPAQPVVTPPPQPQPSGGAFGPLQPLAPPAQTQTQTHINTKRPDEGGLGRSTLLLMIGVAFLMIIGVGVLIWYEGRTRRSVAKRRRQRLRSGRTPQPEAAGAGRRGPPPPPRKRRAQAAKRRKR
ncbi:MAG: hypothetical protein ACJ76Z_13465 [Thermoleophilaceae bacterium]